MKKALRILTLVYYTNYISALLSAVIGYYFLRNNIKIDAQSQIGIIISTILIILIIGSVPLTLSLFNRYTKKIAIIEDIETRIAKYQAAGIVRIQIMGFGLVLGVLFFYLMGSQSMLFCAGIAAIGLFFCKPTPTKISTDLQIDEE